MIEDKKSVYISGPIPEAGIKLLTENGIAVEQWKGKDKIPTNELIKACKKHQAFLSVGRNKIDQHFLEECKHLKVIALFSVGYDHVDVKEANKLNIPVGNTPGVLSGATADTAFLLMLAASRKAFYQYKQIIDGEWKKGIPANILGIELYGKTLGIFGLGRIGIEMAKRCKGAYDMEIIYHNRGRNKEAEELLGAKRVSFDDLLKESDVLSVHTELSKETENKFDKKAFEQMKESAIFINTSRGGVHNEKDLTEAIKKGIIWGAGLDVTNPEPMGPSSELLNMPSVAVLPHIGSATVETRNQMIELAAKNIIAGLNNKKLPTEIKLKA
jgi:glyoxylate reductase